MSAWRAACRVGPTAAWCRSAAIPACRAAPRSAACRASTPRRRRAGAERVGLSVSRECRGWTASEMIDHAAAGDVDVFWIVGGNFLETLPDAGRGRGGRCSAVDCASTRTSCCPRRCWWTATATCCCCRPPPATNRRAAAPKPRPSGGSSSRRRFPGAGSARRSRSGGCSAKSMARGVSRARDQIRFDGRRGDPREIGRGGAALQGDRDAAREGRPGPVGRPHALRGRPVRDAGRQGALRRRGDRTVPAERVAAEARESSFLVSTRRGKQFNSMVQRDVDPLTGAAPRGHPDQRRRIWTAAAARRDVPSCCARRADRSTGRLKRAAIKPGNLEVHWPEGNVLLSAQAIDPESLEPDYNAVVTIERA